MVLSPQMNAEYMTKQEVAEYMRVSVATIDRLMLKGLPHIKLDRRVLFRKKDIDAFLEKKIIGKTPASSR